MEQSPADHFHRMGRYEALGGKARKSLAETDQIDRRIPLRAARADIVHFGLAYEGLEHRGVSASRHRRVIFFITVV